MNSTIKQWGNSLGVRIPKSYAGDLGFEDGSKIEIVLVGKTIVLKPKRQTSKPKYKIEDLVKGMNSKNQHDVIEWGGPVGKEVW